jgi:hypothetical protein
MSQKPIPDPATRLDLTKKVIAGAKIPQAAPAGFDPLKATPEELKSYGLPPKPDAKTDPQRYARWSKHLSKTLTFIAPTFKIIEKDRDPRAKNQAEVASNATSSNWSGVVLTDPTPAKQYTAIEGEWIIPNAYPNSSNTNGIYEVSVWVGIDGWGNGEVVQTGTDSYVTDSGGKITSQGAFPWYEWYPAYAIEINNFAVHPGDTIWGYIDVESATEAYAFLYNIGAGTYTSTTFPAPKGTSLIGGSAEWIVENPDINNVETLFPDFGSTVFFDTYAYSGAWQNLSNGGTIITLDEGGNTLAEVIDETATSFIDIYV